MKVIVVYRENTDYARGVTDFLRDFKYRTGHDLETMDPDTPAGTQYCETYDIMQFPTIIATSDDGSLLKAWNGLPMPTINEVSYYVQQN